MQSISRKPYRFNFPFMMSEKADHLYPLKLGDIPEFIISIGMMSKIEYEIYTIANGRHTVQQIAHKLQISSEKARMVVDSMIKRRILKICKDAVQEC